ncbi:MAG: chloride channel protein [Kiloniellales bacterium]
MVRRFRQGLRLLVPLKRLARSEQMVLAPLAVVIGATAAVGAIAFREALGYIQFGFYFIRSEQLYSWAETLPWWQVMLAPAAGGLLVGLYLRFVMPGGRPQGVAEVIEAMALKGGQMPLKAGFGAAVVSALSLGAGASAGREGPVVHLGASLAAWFAARLHLNTQFARTILGCGVASAVAASFNAPIAGVFFALEVVIGHYALRAFAPIVIAAVTGTVLSRLYFGDFPAFIVPAHEITSILEFPAFALLGVVSAAVAIIFMGSIMFADKVVASIPTPSWLAPVAGGLAVGLIALVFPQVLGVGYQSTDEALNELLLLELLIGLIVAKTAATAITLGCRFGGGVFSPSLFLGAMLGGAFGLIATQAAPELSSGTGAYTMVGMGAVAGAVLGAPISTILMIFELTGDYQLTIAVMIATVIASVITQQVLGHSFFTWQLARRGVDLEGGRELGVLRATHVDDLMHRIIKTVTTAAGPAEIREHLRREPRGPVFVVDEAGRLKGTITLPDLADVAFDTSLDALIKATDVMRPNPPLLAAGDDVETVVGMLSAAAEPYVAVVDNRRDMKLVGCLHEHDAMVFYSRTLAAAREEQRGER